MPYGYWYNQSGLGCDRRGGLAGIARGLSELPRGARIHWEGDVTGWASGFGTPGAQNVVDNILKGQGFNVELLDYQTYWTSWNDFRILITAVTPSAYAIPEDAFSLIKAAVWTAYDQEPRNISASVLNAPVVTQGGQTVYQVAPNIADSPDAANDPCKYKTGLDYAACVFGFDKLGSSLGFGITAGTGLLLGALLLGAVVILKK